MKVVWSASIPKELAKSVKPSVLRYLPCLPCWVERFHIEFDDEGLKDDSTLYLSVEAQEEMRHATLYVRSEWLSLDEEQREETVSHEFAHIPFLPASAICDEILSLATVPTPLKTQWEARVEAATQDYAKILRKAYGK